MNDNKNDWYELQHILEDQIFDLVLGEGWWNDDSPNFDKDSLHIALEEQVDILKETICNLVGCKVVKDHCGMAKHDHCLLCHELRPGQAVNEKRES